MADVSSNEVEVSSSDMKAKVVTPVKNGKVEATGDNTDAVVTEPAASEPAKPVNGSSASTDETKAATSKESPSQSSNDDLKHAMMLLASGKRDFLVKDYSSAVTSLGECCEVFARIYGDGAIECGDPLFYYGRALLELARLEAGVIDNVLDGVPEEDDCDNSQVEDPEKCTEEEKDNVTDEVMAAIEENFNDLEKLKEEKAKKEAAASNGEATKSNGEAKVTNGDEKTNGDAAETNGDVEMKADDVTMKTDDVTTSETEKKTPDESSEQNSAEEEDEEGGEEEDGEAEAEGDQEMANEDEPSAKEDAESIGSNEAGPSSAKEVTDKSATEQEEEEDPSNLQLAWEVLDLAKSVFHKQLDKLEEDSPLKADVESKLNETYMTLGEVSIENEDYNQAIEDLTTCLKRRQKTLPEDSRIIAETHYQLGVALGFNKQFDEAVNALNDAIGVLQLRIENLKAEKESKDPSKAEDIFYTREREIAEIEGLIPEIHEKIADTNDMKKEELAKTAGEELSAGGSGSKIEATNGETNGTVNGDSTKSVSNIGHLVKKRKKSEESGEAETNGTDSAKKPHIDSEAAAATSNGN